MTARKSDICCTPNRRPLCFHCGEADHLYHPHTRHHPNTASDPGTLRTTTLSSATSRMLAGRQLYLPSPFTTATVVSYRAVTQSPTGKLSKATSGGGATDDRSAED
ncbi:hypothetical protein HPB50_004139 [Hyalomma asiaticum]|uniref:Uncharacterized protein n=1 Tax=Hyalomma asiaticum TaxID=266040 RepID=A0ACB7SBC7_HYAAI|nr:hypothetical protein HPB50_004139 [Hyalomma asiaticum]